MENLLSVAPPQKGKRLVKRTLPTEITIGGRSYDLLSHAKGRKKSTTRRNMVRWAKKKNAHLGQEDGEHVLKYQDEIPPSLQGKVVFIFPDWHHPNDLPESIYCICWRGSRWVQDWYWIGGKNWFNDIIRLLRRNEAPKALCP